MRENIIPGNFNGNGNGDDYWEIIDHTLHGNGNGIEREKIILFLVMVMVMVMVLSENRSYYSW